MRITIREPGSALTHLAGVILVLMTAAPLLIRTAAKGGPAAAAGMLIFSGSMLMLYTASTLYHAVTVRDGILRRFRKADHMMIFVLIAGSYTPVCLITLRGHHGGVLLTAIWSLALTGMTVKFFWIDCPKWFSSLIYIAMGWTCVFILPDLIRYLPATAFRWLLAGGVIYTAGGVIYALRLPLFRQRPFFGNHELFHLFVLAGSICHFVCMFHLL